MSITQRANSKERRYGCVYKITNLVNGKVYVGQTIQTPEKRWAYHKSISGIKKLSLLQKAFKKHGIENFSFDIVKYAENQQDLNMMEDYFIEHFNALAPTGYTCVGSRDRDSKISNETRAKMSAARVGKAPANKGKKYKLNLSEESRKRYSEANTRKNIGRKISEATREKMSLAKKGKAPMSPERYKEIGTKRRGVKLSEEARRNMSLAKIGYVQPDEIIRKMAMSKTKNMIKRINLKTGEEKLYSCAIDLKLDGFSYTSVFNVAKGKKYRHSYKGYKWEFSPKEGVK